MKKVSLLVAALLAAVASVSAQAATATNTFNVAINLTSACQIKTVPAIAFTYTAFQAATVNAASTFDIQCTNNLPIAGIAVDGTGTYADLATGLSYTLAVGTVPFFGNGLAQTINITGTMAGNQPGNCGSGSCNNSLSTDNKRTLTITY